MTLPRLSVSDPRVIASRERLMAIPQWRLFKIWRAAGRHTRLVNEVLAEKSEEWIEIAATPVPMRPEQAQAYRQYLAERPETPEDREWLRKRFLDQ